MKKPYRIIGILLIAFVSSWLFHSCRTKNGGPFTVSSATSYSSSELSVIQTMAVQTVQAFPTVTPPADATLSPAASSHPVKTETSGITSIPFEIAALLPAECNQVLMYDNYPYTMNECKLPVISPDDKYLAYVTLVLQMVDEGVYPLESVRVMEIKTGQYEEVHVVKPRNHIGLFEWNLSGELIFWESIWEGPWVIYVYDPVTDQTLVTMRADRGAALQWNPQHTAFYVSRSGGYGHDNCVKELGGYDFESGSRFPDLYKVFNLKIRDDDPFGISYGAEDNLYIEPFGWSLDGKYLRLTVMLLDWKGDEKYEYEVGPSQAGVIEISTTGVMYKPLATDEYLDYFFEGLPNPKIVSQPYQSRVCPER